MKYKEKRCSECRQTKGSCFFGTGSCICEECWWYINKNLYNKKQSHAKKEVVGFGYEELRAVLVRINGFCRSWDDIRSYKKEIIDRLVEKKIIDPERHTVVFNEKNKNYDNKWRETRKTIINRDGGECVVCGEVELLTVHHKNRDTTNNEPENLTTLCWGCHSTFHPHMNEAPPKGGLK